MRHVLGLVFLCLLAMSCLAFEESDSYYKILDVNRNATPKEIKKAYHKMSMEYHPDRNKAPNARDKFATIAEAYEVLKDQDKRQTYDRHGKEGVKQQAARGDGGADPFEQFEEMFGGGFGGFGGGRRGGRRQQRRKGPELNTKIRLTLEELYTGKEIPFLMSKTVVCDHCRGSGAEDPEDIKQCTTCGGQGIRMMRQQVAPGFVQQYQMECDVCGGQGKVIRRKCHACNGTKTHDGHEKMNLYVEKGMTSGNKIDFSGGAREYIEWNASDLVFTVQEIAHQKYKRKGSNLMAKLNITLKEALLGFDRTITSLDNRQIRVKKDGTSQPGDVVRVSGEGMPVRNYGSKGDLLVTLNVNLPSEMSAEKATLWKNYFSVAGTV